MKISKLIAELVDIIAKNGDLDVVISNIDDDKEYDEFYTEVCNDKMFITHNYNN